MKTLILIFMGIACGFAIQNILPLPAFDIILYAFIFSSTIARFFEGNIIYYGSSSNNTKKSKVDVYIMLLQFIIFSAMGYFIGDLQQFIYAFIVLNIVDSIWHGVVYIKNKPRYKTSLFWSLSNMIFGIILMLYLYQFNNLLTKDNSLLAFAILALVATIADYWYNKDFYFNNEAKKIFEYF